MFREKKTTGAFLLRPLSRGEEVEVCNLVARSFNEFIAPEFSDDGIEEFFRYANPRALLKRSEGSHDVFVADAEGIIAGVIEIREQRHISMLFVDKEFHRRGIARELTRHVVEKIKSSKRLPGRVTVNSSTFALPFYESVGFRQASDPKIIHGVLHIPMALTLAGGKVNNYENTDAQEIDCNRDKREVR